MKIWMYYTTDGDSGYYNIKLFSVESLAIYHKEVEGNSYGRIEEVEVETPKLNPSLENVKCPECGGAMISRSGKYGTFWGCKKYPECKGTRDSMGRSKSERESEREKSDYDSNPENSSSNPYRFTRGGK
jgi:tRNA(Ile2) C34 agmatinyltransferase TiaS